MLDKISINQGFVKHGTIGFGLGRLRFFKGFLGECFFEVVEWGSMGRVAFGPRLGKVWPLLSGCGWDLPQKPHSDSRYYRYFSGETPVTLYCSGCNL